LIGFRVFSLPVTGPFQLSLTVLYAIGLPSCFALEVDASYLRSSYPRGTTLVEPAPFSGPYGTITLCSATFQSTSGPRVSGGHSTHISYTFRCRIRFALCRVRSLLLTASRLITFPAVTKTFQFTAFAILTDSVVTHIRVSLVRSLLAARQCLLQLATPFVAEEAKPSTDQCLFRIILFSARKP
jgi:hypothetical protein